MAVFGAPAYVGHDENAECDVMPVLNTKSAWRNRLRDAESASLSKPGQGLR